MVQHSAAIYIPVDHRYYFEDNGVKQVSIEPGYQLLDGDQALKFVRFRHDGTGDFGRMQRQQLFLKEMQRQSGRWSNDWTQGPHAHQGDHQTDDLRHRLAQAPASRSSSLSSR